MQTISLKHRDMRCLENTDARDNIWIIVTTQSMNQVALLFMTILSILSSILCFVGGISFASEGINLGLVSFTKHKSKYY